MKYIQIYIQNFIRFNFIIKSLLFTTMAILILFIFDSILYIFYSLNFILRRLEILIEIMIINNILEFI